MPYTRSHGIRLVQTYVAGANQEQQPLGVVCEKSQALTFRLPPDRPCSLVTRIAASAPFVPQHHLRSPEFSVHALLKKSNGRKDDELTCTPPVEKVCQQPITSP